MRKVAIIQARMGSERLPGKVLRRLCGVPMLGHIVRRVKRSCLLDDVWVATSVQAADDAVASYCLDNGINVFRGNEADVLDRYLQCARYAKADLIVRITGDCPLIHPPLIDDMVGFFLKGNWDYATVHSSEDFIRGLDVEVFNWDTLVRAWRKSNLSVAREHVTWLMYNAPELFKAGRYEVPGWCNNKNLRLCVDTEEDFQLVETIYETFYSPESLIDTKKVVEYLMAHPEIASINAHVKQKKV